LIWPIDLDRYATNDSGKEILSSEAENDRNNAGARQQSFQLCLSVIAVTQNKQQDDQEDEAADYFAQKMRNRRATVLFEIQIPNVTINQSNNQCSAQQDRCCSYVIAPGCVNSINGNRGVEGDN